MLPEATNDIHSNYNYTVLAKQDSGAFEHFLDKTIK